jgi:hypothetical protein
VADGLQANSWARDISGELTVEALRDYLRLWSVIQGAPQQGNEEVDSFRWKWTSCGSYSSKTAHRTFFHGKTTLPSANNMWNSVSPLKFKMHAWLALWRRCWTLDCRWRRGLPMHIMCPLCGSREKTIDHLTLHCPDARALWTGAVTRHKLPNIVPSELAKIGEWLPAAVVRFSASERKTSKSFIILVMRTLWLERNARVFERSPTTVQATLRLMLDEWSTWMRCRHGSQRDTG